MSSAPEAKPEAGPEPFGVLYRKTTVVVSNLTVLILLVRGASRFVGEARGRPIGEALAAFGIELTIQILITVLFNSVFLALPIAGIIQYGRFLARRR